MNMNALPDTAPGFDQPIAVLKHCHDRIRKQLATMQKLLPHLARHGADEQAQQAAQAVIKYFDKAAHLHHADEEENLVPMLQSVAQGEDAATLAELVPGILRDHDEMDAMWQQLHEELSAIADGSGQALSASAVEQFAQRYADHMEREETQIAPMAKRLFSAAQMAQLGEAMQVRRGILPAPAAGEAVAALRKDYGQDTLNEADVAADPFDQFNSWFEQALAAEVNEPNAMSVATVDADGKPTSRIVLIKQFDRRGFTWYTNYDSQKGRQLAANPHAALLFFWSELERQIRIEGIVERTSAEESDKYFNSRPLKSRLAAIASAQSAPIANREALEQHYDAVAKLAGDAPPRPDNWGGFRLTPQRIEFWQGRRSRFHDRIVYTLQPDGSWKHQRLQP
ncbi:pyridoxamine 5'-phosphate oxidase [Massilia sp. R2A-15]|uniref:pyridoxamine 5'-phosphate oxidase n=1 Tax=Massilia sp. R2A-15 TaxID=3064278 RepID=UPI002733A2BB|nr:pyridoxamine 5'-phosphate oxidase [Massilia sp. R2A-15]WLI88564.1 pyridoxamine 5'-phosphate oxidase [Massilia sp. R2A-15]